MAITPGLLLHAKMCRMARWLINSLLQSVKVRPVSGGDTPLAVIEQLWDFDLKLEERRFKLPRIIYPH